MIIVSFYTLDTPYEEEVKSLRESLEKLELKHDIQGVKLDGTWRENLHYKPVFIKEMLDKHQESVFWLDADAVVRGKPNLLYSTKCDVAFAMHNGFILNGAALYFANTKMARNILDRWVKFDKAHLASDLVLDQTTLQLVVTGYDMWETDTTIMILPPSYCKIFDSKSQEWAQPVIVQNQASRRFKEHINRVSKERYLLPVGDR